MALPSQRRDAIGDFGSPDGAQREQVVEGQRDIAGGDESAGGYQRAPIGCFQCIDQFLDVDIAQDAIKDDDGDDDDGEAHREAEPAPADPAVERVRTLAQSGQHAALHKRW